MRINHYTPTLSSKKHYSGIFQVSKKAETMMLSVLAFIGIAGTVFVMSNRPSYQNAGPSMPEYGAVTSIVSSLEAENKMASDFNKYIKMASKANVGEAVIITFLEDEKASRYVMDMGDGVRLVVTQKNLEYVYDKPGKYTIELKEIQRGILHLRGTKVLKVKE